MSEIKAQLIDEIKEQGEIVRKLKAEKSSKEQVCLYNKLSRLIVTLLMQLLYLTCHTLKLGLC